MLTHREAFQLLTCAFPEAPEDGIEAALLDAIAACDRADLHDRRQTLAAKLADIVEEIR